MSNQVPVIQQILTTSEIRQYLNVNANAKANIFNGGVLTPYSPELIDAIRQGVQDHFNHFPSDPSLIQTGNWLFRLVAPILTPNTNLLTSNLNAVAVSSSSIQLSWAAVPNGVTYTLTRSLNAGFTSGVTVVYTGGGLGFTDTGLSAATQYFYMMVVSAPGFTNSPASFANATTQSIVPSITGFFYYGSTSPYAALAAGTDSLIYQTSFPITHNSPIPITLPTACSPNMFLVVKVPIGESVKANWFNNVTNNGVIPDAAWEAVLQPAGLPNFSYYVSRNPLSLVTTSTLILS
jgi:hypothetical protein